MLRNSIALVVAALAVATAAPARAGDNGPLSGGAAASDRLISIEQMQGIGQRVAQQKRDECLRAFGYDPFCRCLAESLPFQVGMQDYMRILANSPAELKERRKGLPPEEQQLIDAVLGSRDHCVQVFAPAK